jgi:MATE family, multidrug efflux pump
MKHLSEIFRVTLPLVASTASYTVLTFTDRMFLSWYSPEAIAASVPAAVLCFSAICFFMGTGQYVNVLISQYFGASHNIEVARSFWQGIYFSLFSAVILIFLIPVGCLIIDISGHSPEVIVQEKAYFEVLLFGGGLVVLMNVLAAFYSGRSRTKIVMYVSFLGAIINIILNYILIFGKMGFPELGIMGAGLATVLANAVIVAIYVGMIFWGSDRHIIPVTRYFGFSWKIFKKLVRFGAPNGLQFFIDVSGFTIFVFLIGLHGDDIMAASNIVFSVNMLAFMPMVGFGQATAILTGRYMGRKEPEFVISITSETIKIVGLYGVGIGAVFFFFPEFFIQFFQSSDTESFQRITDAAIPLFMILPLFLIGDTAAIIFGSVLAGTGDTAFKMWFSIIATCLIFIPGEILILKVFSLQAIYGWIWITVYLTLVGLVYWLRFRKGQWKNIDMIG